MAKIIPKLNLNRTPQTVDNYSLIAAKNIKLNKDNSFSRDTGIEKINLDSTEGLVGCISYNTKLYLFYNTNIIKEYDEVANSERTIDCAWKYSGGIIDGKVIVNLKGETLLVINEYKEDDSNPLNVPIKTINIDKCSSTDDESIYTQTPKIQLFDLIHVRDYTEPIQAGVYTFFGRYEIKEGFYSNWFPVSRPLYAGQKKLVNTIQGSVEYVDENVNCGVSFVFDVIRPDNNIIINNYKYLQIGFILKTDAGEVARSWKKFPINVKTIYFDNKKEYIQEININDFFKPIYNNYNVKNLTTFKHKTYISNYIETNANPDLERFAKQINISIKNVDLQKQQTEIYDNKVVSVKQLPVIIDDTLVTKEVITKLGDVSFNDYFKDYYLSQNKIVDNFINHTGLLRIVSNPIGKVNTEELIQLITNSAKTFGTIRRETIEGKMLSVILKKIHDKTFKDENNKKYFPTEIPANEFSAFYGFFSKDFVSNNIAFYTNLYYVNSLQLHFPDSSESLDLIANYKGEANDSNNYSDYTANSHKLTNGYGEKGLFTTDVNKLIIDILHNHIVGITTNNEVIIKIKREDGIRYYTLETLELCFHYTNLVGNGRIREETTAQNEICYAGDYNTNYGIDFRKTELKITPNSNLFFNFTNLIKTNITTLIPEQDYNFYIHFVKNTGETTNGYYITTKKIALIPDNRNAILNHHCFYPQFINGLSTEDKSLLAKEGYLYYFISCIKNNTTIECTGYQCLEFDLLLNRSDKVNVTSLNESNIEKSSGYYVDDTGESKETLKYFGSGGYLISDAHHQDPAFIINNYNLHEKELSLTKVTPYTSIQNSIDLSPQKLNCLGYLCYYRKPIDKDTTRYISGGEIYTKSVSSDTLDLSLIYGSVPIIATDDITIYSNYNLNFLRLSVSIQEQIRMYQESANDDTQHKELTKYINSISLKDLYLLPSTYKDYTTYNYFNYNPDNNKYKFDNTIRSSSLRGDEANTFILTFDSTDYYNVPTNKGIVIKLAGIGDTMLVHTQDSIFEFNGKPSIASDSAAQIVETDIFDSGITEVIPSEYGLAGLQHKKHALVTPFGYVFWDAQINTIYYYAGKGQIAPISDSIRKVLDGFNPNNVNLSYDYINDRFFINFVNSNKQSINLSYNIKAKAFVSFHDFAYDYSVNTKNKTYYIKNNIIGVISNTKSYLDFYKKSAYVIHKDEKENQGIYSYIDILINTEYEKIKTLDSITWICSGVGDLQKTPTEYDNLAEDVSDNPYPGNRMIIYTDTCVSNPIILQSSTLCTIKDYTKGDYKSPVYNLGKFTVNYFRNVKLGTNVEQTLMYGKYFGVRIFFDTNAHTNNFDDFKLENIELLYTLENYGKI